MQQLASHNLENFVASQNSPHRLWQCRAEDWKVKIIPWYSFHNQSLHSVPHAQKVYENLPDNFRNTVPNVLLRCIFSKDQDGNSISQPGTNLHAVSSHRKILMMHV